MVADAAHGDEDVSLDRRAFFRRGVRKITEVAVKGADAHVTERAAHWIRPPYALDELEFLLACTRCGDCIDACPHQVIFPLPARLGVQVAATPALDLVNKGCHLCEDWPCVTACERHALRHFDAEPEDDEPGREAIGEPDLPFIALARVDPQTCLPYSGPECGACRGVCPVPGAMIWEQERPRIDPDPCTGCALCREACIVEPKAIRIQSKFVVRL